MAGVCGVLDDAAGLHQAPGPVDVLDGWEPGDVLSRHYLLNGIAVVDGAVPVPGHDASGQDALDGAAVVFGEDPGWYAKFLQLP